MKLIIDIPDEMYDCIKKDTESEMYIIDVIKKGTPYEPKGDLISREDLKKDINSLYEYDTYNEEFDAAVQSILNFIDNAPTVAVNCKDCDGYEAGYSAGLKDAERPNCVTCDHFGKCEGCEKREEE